MKKGILVLSVLLLMAGCATVAYYPQREDIWPLVAQSDLIVTGKLSVPVESIRSCLSSNKHEFVEITVACDQILRGSPEDTLRVRWYTEQEDYSPAPARVIGLNDKTALLFLVSSDEDGGRLYFAGSTPRALAEADASLIEQVRQEVANQQSILAEFAHDFPSQGAPLYAKVKALVDATMQTNTQANAFRKLEKLGWQGVPAMIMVMDDRRDLAIPRITLQNLFPCFEACRYYGPKKVVDAMAAILNQITGEDFASIYNGGTERERQKAVNGWRIYLHYWKKGTHNSGH